MAFTKLRPKQEQFLWLVIEGVPQRDAYAQVYGQHLNANTCAASSSKLLTVPKVMARRQELIAAKVARSPVTASFLTLEALATAAESRALGQGSAAIAGYALVAKLHGLIVDRQQTDVIVRKPSASPDSPDDMTADAWLQDFGVTVIEHNSTSPILETHQEVVEVEGATAGSEPGSIDQV